LDPAGTTEWRRDRPSTRSLAGWERTPAWPAFILARVHLLVDEGHPDMAAAELRRYEHTATGPAVLGTEGAFTLARTLRHPARHIEAPETLDRLEPELRVERTRGRATGRRPALRRRVRFDRVRLVSWLSRLGECAPRGAIELLAMVEEVVAVPLLRAAWAERLEGLVCMGGVG